MQTQPRFEPWRAALTVWGIVNVVNLLQAAGFLSRVYTGSMAINNILGYGMIVLTIPAFLALVSFARARVSWLHWAGPTVYLAFIGLMVIVDYLWPVEFRAPMRYEILAPYLVLFFGSIFLMGLPMFRLNRRLWFITVITSILLLVTMGIAMNAGVG